MMFKRVYLGFIVLCVSMFAHAGTMGLGGIHYVEVSVAWLYLKPMSNNHTYAYYVAGEQPYSQSWHAQSVNPSYSSAFELGLLYHVPESLFNASLDWIHLDTGDSANKIGNQSTDFETVAFVGPPFNMGPQVFGIRRADAELKYNYDNVAVNLEKIFELSEEWWSAKIIAGVNVLYLRQSLSTTFSDFVGATTPLTFPLPADPNFSFNIHSVSKFTGAGPDLGLHGQLNIFRRLSIIGAASCSLNVGTTDVQENFSSTSTTLMQTGIALSKQQITTPNKTQIVPGFDGKLGLMYQIKNKWISDFRVEGGYRLITYMNAISTTEPQTMVDTGTGDLPNFSTGTMGIVSAAQQDRPFNLNGPYVAITLSVM